MAKNKPKPKGKPNAMHIFVAAEQFWNSKQVLDDHHEKHGNGMAIISIAAISLELYFKCLLADDDRFVPETHDLRFLFNRLGDDTKREIQANFQPELADAQDKIMRIAQHYGRKVIPVAGFDYFLDLSRYAFVTMRYFYENGIPEGEGWAADGIVRATRDLILSKHPDWEAQRLVDPPVFVTRP